MYKGDGHTHIYEFIYDNESGEFMGYVFEQTQGEKALTTYCIDDIDEMRTMIEDGIMKHIDDVDGLEKYLKTEKVLGPHDSIQFGGVHA